MFKNKQYPIIQVIWTNCIYNRRNEFCVNPFRESIICSGNNCTYIKKNGDIND